MRTHVNSRYLLALGAVFLWGCPIDDAHFATTSSSASSTGSSSGDSSSSNSSSSSSSGGGAGGNGGGVAGMGGATASSSSSSGTAGGGGMGGAGGGPVCLAAPGTVGSCGTMNCPPCPTLVMVGTGLTDGVTGSFVSSDANPWTTKPIMNEASMHDPTLVMMPGQNMGLALLRRNGSTPDGLIRYSIWNQGAFDVWKTIDSSINTKSAVSAVVMNSDVHIAYHGFLTQNFYYVKFAGPTKTFGLPAEVVDDDMNMAQLPFGSFAPVISARSSGPFLAYSGGNKQLFRHERIANGTWPSNSFNTIVSVTEVPAVAAFKAGSTQELLVVFAEEMTYQLYSLRLTTDWNTPKVTIAGAMSKQPVLLALPNGDALLAYRDSVDGKTIKWSRFTSNMNSWSTPKALPGMPSPTAKSKPALALGAGDAEAELLFVDDMGNAQHARLRKDEPNFDLPVLINGASGLVGIAAATNL